MPLPPCESEHLSTLQITNQPGLRFRALLTDGSAVLALGEAVEDAHYEVGETKSGLAVREPVSEVDVRVLAGGSPAFSGG